MKKALILFSRAFRLRCPACRGGPLFDNWLKIKKRCPGCGLLLDRGEGHFVGGMALNLMVSETLWLLGLVLALYLTWPNPPWTTIMIVSVMAMVLFPVLFYPFSRTLWYAFDLFFQPIDPEEFRRAERERQASQARSRT